ncbi:MAG TPA: superoxide dismutase [Rhizomicrobium sp.]|jgi:Fe-Mn family superoxide dismutase|nr:superoxide dismutase [Rhizomicrobium sp.]
MAQPFELSPLPYDEGALAPTISARTVEFHYHKHHKTYVETLNKLVADSRYADMKLEQIIRTTAGSTTEKENKIFNNAGQVWNHDFYWRSLSPKATTPSGKLLQAIEREFGGLDTLLAQLAEAGTGQFGSGWAWLISKGGKLSVAKTGNAMGPMADHVNCLLTIDVWEHAYYLDYQNLRAKYLEAVLGKLDWDFAAENLDKENHPVRAAA